MKNFKCFLASNSAEGFVSHFSDCYDPTDGWHTYIIKGGPGTGKSSFMKKVRKEAEEKGISYIEVFCASDPASLDGLIFPTEKTSFMDGTAPHIVEPRFPGVCENLLDFGQFWDSAKLRKKDSEIISATKENKLCHKNAGEFIRKAGEIMKNTAEPQAETDYSLAEKHIPARDGTGKIFGCFLGGITPDGIKYFTDSINADKVITLDGKNAEGILKDFKQTAAKRGFDAVCFENPILPCLTDGIFIPELSLLAVKSRFVPEDREFAELLDLASREIARAKEIHDKLEGYYIEAMNFAALDSFANKVLEKIFAKK